jgi:hypothetical protein
MNFLALIKPISFERNEQDKGEQKTNQIKSIIYWGGFDKKQTTTVAFVIY